MTDKKTRKQNKVNDIIFFIGLFAVLFMGVPYLILGQDAIVTYHDQLDGELIAYLLQAKHLFQGDILPEFMNGAYKTALIPPAPAFVLLFLAGDGYAGLVCMQLLGSFCGYIGMYLLIEETAHKAELAIAHKTVWSFVAVAVAVIYAYLPFLPVYGLAQYGLPLLLWCLLQARSGKHVKFAYFYGAVYALTSSLVLVGFGVLGVLAVWLIGCAVKQHRNKKSGVADVVGKAHPGHMLGIWSTMLLLYVMENASLLKQTLGIGEQGGELSHKAEYVLASSDFWDGLVQGFTKGGQHSIDYHEFFLAAVLFVLVLGLVSRLLKNGRAQENEKLQDHSGWNSTLLTVLGVSVGCNFAFAGIAALWDSSWGIAIRSHMSALGAFQLNRLLWLAPCLWYLSLGCTVLLVLEFAYRKKATKRLVSGICFLLMAGVMCVTGGKVLLESNLKPNIQKLLNPEYSMFSFSDYYAIGVLEQVEEFIYETTGEEQEEYRVVSLGIDSAAALYHGFYCLDGYSNNYSLDYKHAFRSIIAPELAKNEYLTENFDNWGNRCYLFSAECPGYYTVEKNGFFYQDFSIDTEALKAMGGKYLFSAAYIQNGDEIGLKLLRETPFETEDSYYRIFLYEID